MLERCCNYCIFGDIVLRRYAICIDSVMHTIASFAFGGALIVNGFDSLGWWVALYPPFHIGRLSRCIGFFWVLLDWKT